MPLEISWCVSTTLERSKLFYPEHHSIEVFIQMSYLIRPYTEFEILSISRLKMSFTEKKFLLAHKMLRSEYEKIWPNWNFEQSSKCQSPRKKIRILYDVFSKHHFTLGLARWHGCDREKIYSTLHGILVKSNNEAVCAVCWNVL